MKYYFLAISFILIFHKAVYGVSPVYFAIRQDGLSGSGTQSDPYNGSYISDTQNFDTRMQQVTRDFLANQPTPPVQNEIILAQGLYWTWGDEETNGGVTRGYLLPPNTKLRGAGMGRTIIKLRGVNPWGPRFARNVVSTGVYSLPTGFIAADLLTNCPNVTVQDLTIDGNSDKIWPQNEEGGFTSEIWGVFCLRLNGSGSQAIRVEALHACAVYEFGAETAAIMLHAELADSLGILVDSCVVDQTWGGYVNGINVFAGPRLEHRISGTIQNCIVKNNPWAAFNISTGSNGAITQVVGNTIIDCRIGFYWDTGSLYDTVFKNNTFIISDVDTRFASQIDKYHLPVGGPNPSRALSFGPYNNLGYAGTTPAPIISGNITVYGNYFRVPGASKGFIHLGKNNGAPVTLFPTIANAYSFLFKNNTFASDNSANQIFGVDVDDGTNDSDEILDGIPTYESQHPEGNPPNEYDMTPWYKNIQFGGGNILQAHSSSQLWRPKPNTMVYQTPSSSILPVQYPDVTWNLPSTGYSPILSFSTQSYTVTVGTTIQFNFTVTNPLGASTLTFISPNLPFGATLKYVSSGAAVSLPLSLSGNGFGANINFAWTPSLDQVGKHVVSFIGDNGRAIIGVTTIEVTPNPNISPITWIKPVNAIATSFAAGSCIEKRSPGGVDNVYDAKAISAERILGDGSISFRFSTTDKVAVVGLSSANPSVIQRPEFCIVAKPSGIYEINELLGSGTLSVISPIGPSYDSSTVFTISRENGVIKYYRNGALVYTSVVTPQQKLPLFAAGSFYNFGKSVFDCLIKNGVPAEDTAWSLSSTMTATLPVADGGSTVTKTSGGAGWNAEILSAKKIVGDGFVSFRFGQIDKRILIGLASDSPNTDPLGPEYVIAAVPGTSPYVQIQDFWSNPRMTSPLAADDIFRIERKGDVVSYYKNNALLCTSVWKNNLPMMVECNAYDPGASVKNLIVGGAQSVEPVVWQSAVGVTAAVPGNTGSQLTKTAATTGWDSEAVSSKRMTGDGYVQFRFAQTDKWVMVGLTARDREPTPYNCEFMLQAKPFDAAVGGPGVAIVDYKDQWRGTYPYTTGDSFRIERKDGVVRYYKNGNLLQTSYKKELLPLMAIGQFQDQGATIKDCILSADMTFEPISWQAATNLATTVDRGSRLEKISGGNAWNADSIASKKLQSHAVLQFQFADPMKGATMQLANSSGIIFNIEQLSSGQGYVSSANDVITVWRQGTTLDFYRNANLFHTMTVALEPITVHGFIHDQGGALKNCNYGGVAP